ncbi:MAG: cysteine hydrolase [Candidatus Moranbacteria bacterium]|nr:cysteine hydrolase [Candidatus Moranbacteria bacterium]
MSKKALLIIDVQNYYINSYTEKLPLKIEKYIKQTNFDYILFAKFVNNKGSSFWNNLSWKKMCSSPDTDICKNLLPYTKKDTVFIKSTYSIFKSKSFLRYIKKNKIAELTLCGFDTDACVLASAYDGFDLGYKISVKNDLTASHRGEAFTEYGLNIINGNIQ